MGGVDVYTHVFLTSALAGVEWSASRSVGQEGAWAPELIWTTCPHRDWNSDPSIVQPVASRYTDCAITAVYIALEMFQTKYLRGLVSAT
jgi:hypothetical protein